MENRLAEQNTITGELWEARHKSKRNSTSHTIALLVSQYLIDMVYL